MEDKITLLVEHVSIIFDLDSTIFTSLQPEVDGASSRYSLETPPVSELCKYFPGSSEVITAGT